MDAFLTQIRAHGSSSENGLYGSPGEQEMEETGTTALKETLLQTYLDKARIRVLPQTLLGQAGNTQNPMHMDSQTSLQRRRCCGLTGLGILPKDAGLSTS